MQLFDKIQVKSNLILTARERGKIVAQRKGHNIWLNLGREWLADLIAYQSFGPDVPLENNRIKFMGVGIGGTAQVAPSVADSPPISPPYTGNNTQTDVDATVTALERPVRVSGSETTYPGVSGDVWAGLIQAPPIQAVATETTFVRVFTQSEVSYGSFQSVPLSEIGLMTAAADPENYKNILVAYDTFDTLSKTNAFELEVRWTIRF